LFSLPDSLFSLPKSLFSLPKSLFSLPNSLFSLPKSLFSLLNSLFSLTNYLFSLPNSLFSLPKSLFCLPNSLFSLPNSLFSLPKSLFSLPNSLFSLSNSLFSLPNSTKCFRPCQLLSNKMRLYIVHYISVNCSTCFEWLLHPSSRAHITVITASGTGQTVSATFRYRGEIGTAFQLLHDSSSFYLWRCDPTRVVASSFLRFLEHTQRHTTVGRTPLDE